MKVSQLAVNTDRYGAVDTDRYGGVDADRYGAVNTDIYGAVDAKTLHSFKRLNRKHLFQDKFNTVSL